MKKLFSNLFTLFKQSYREWRDDHASRLAAAVAYYTLFSLAPLIVLVIAVTSLLWSRDVVQKQILDQIQGLVGAQGAGFVAGMVANTGSAGQGIFATVIGVIALIFGALGAFEALQDSLNAIWDVPEQKTHGFMEGLEMLIADRIVSFGMVLGIGFLLLVSLVISTALTALQGPIGSLLPVSGAVLQIVNQLVSLLVITILFALMFKFLPNATVAWKDVWWGALATAILFTIGKALIGLYLGRSNVTSSYGAAGSLVVLLLWIYYSAQILFFGAELTQVYANNWGSRIVPDIQGARAETRPTVMPSRRATQALPVTGRAMTAPNPSQEQENRRTVRVLAGMLAASFFAGLATTVATLRGRRRR